VVPVDRWRPEKNHGRLRLWEHGAYRRGGSGSTEQNGRAGEISEGKGAADKVAPSGGLRSGPVRRTLLPMVAECRACPLQLVDEQDQVLHSRDVRSGWVVLGIDGREIGGRSVRGEVSPVVSGVGRGETLR
jgi:hypothetical protein